MKISLQEYAKELEYWIKAFEPFVDRTSIGTLRDTRERLLSGFERKAKFEWATARPIKLDLATAYDRAQGEVEPVQVRWRFMAAFAPDLKDKSKRPLWDVLGMNTEVEIYRPDPECLVMRYHHDLKGKDQLGPHTHLQISERFLDDAVGMRLAVPRFPAVALLPTDCLDLVLAEFFPHKWPKAQSEATNLGLMRQGQIERATRLAEELQRNWRKNLKRTPVSLLQNCYFPDLRLA
jgi:hypothetical protein